MRRLVRRAFNLSTMLSAALSLAVLAFWIAAQQVQLYKSWHGCEDRGTSLRLWVLEGG